VKDNLFASKANSLRASSQKPKADKPADQPKPADAPKPVDPPKPAD